MAQPNTEPMYQQLRQIGLGSEAVAVHELILKRDAGTFTLHSGSVCFLAPVNGKVTGAVFAGDGSFSLVPPLAVEQRSIALLTKAPRLEEEFHELVLRFTDDTYAEIKKAVGSAGGAAGACGAGILDNAKNAARKQLHYNLDGRILQDALSDQAGGLFVAFIKGLHYSGKMLYFIDPHGALGVEPEEVELLTYDEDKLGTWAAFHYSGEYQTGQASGTENNAVVEISDQRLDTQIQSNGQLNGKAATRVVSRVAGLRVIRFHLFPTLRVQSVIGDQGQPLAFIQEDKNQDPQFFVILPKALAAGQDYTITTEYGGKEAVRDEGGGNYYPVARTDWYPSGRWSDYATYAMTFAIPKEMELVATGQPLGTVKEGKQVISKWRSEQPQTVAGFQFGKFKEQETKIARLDNFQVMSYANPELPNDIRSLQDAVERARQQGAQIDVTLGGINTTGMLKKALAEAELAVGLYSDYFGPTRFKRLAMTQQTASNYGQSWPELIYLPISYFYDTTIRHQLGWDDPRGYFKVVAPHEVAHQWWGHTVAWGSYRDQWMSEGFSDFSASLYIQLVWKEHPDDFVKFWNDERELLTQRNKEGRRAIDVGPVTLGYRLNNSNAGFNIARDLIYPKGAYILHMIRMMMWDRQTGDANFKALMQDFVKAYAGRAATTEDFKATVEKHMSPEMNLTGDGKMDWFFNQYVYGTLLPTYAMSSSFSTDPDGTIVLNFKLSQSDVDDSFQMLVPLYLEFPNRGVTMLGRARLIGNTAFEKRVPLRGLKEMPKRLILNRYDDVLCKVQGN